MAEDRTEDSLRRFFQLLSEQAREGVKFVASDMWQPYLKVIAEQASKAVHILDRFHIMARMNKAIDKIRAAEAARLRRDG